MKFFLVSLIVIEFIIIIFGVLYIHNNKKIVKVDITNRSNVIIKPSGNYKYFYEPVPNSMYELESSLKNLFKYPEHSTVRTIINSDGMNQVKDYSVNKDKNTFRIITLGDSFTFGLNVNTEDTYPSQLEKKLQERCKNKDIKVEVLNLGVQGYDFSYSVERYRTRGAKYNPDLILWLLITDDFLRVADVQQPILNKMMKEFTNKNPAANLSDIYTNSPEIWIKAKDEAVKQLGGEEKVINLQKNYLSGLSKYYQGKIVLFTFSTTPDKYKNILKEYSSKRNNTFFYDSLPDLIHIPNTIIPNNNHPNKNGYTIISDKILDFIIKNNISPC